MIAANREISSGPTICVQAIESFLSFLHFFFSFLLFRFSSFLNVISVPEAGPTRRSSQKMVIIRCYFPLEEFKE